VPNTIVIIDEQLSANTKSGNRSVKEGRLGLTHLDASSSMSEALVDE